MNRIWDLFHIHIHLLFIHSQCTSSIKAIMYRQPQALHVMFGEYISVNWIETLIRAIELH